MIAALKCSVGIESYFVSIEAFRASAESIVNYNANYQTEVAVLKNAVEENKSIAIHYVGV